MNQEILENYIGFYEAEFDQIHLKEIYKWRAVKHFQERWDLQAVDFPAMLKQALAKTKNLMSSGNYYLRQMIGKLADLDQERVR